MELIIHEPHQFDSFFLRKYKTIYAYKSTFHNIKAPIGIKKVVIPDDLLEEGSKRTAEYRASLISCNIVNNKDLSFLKAFGGETFAKFFSNKPLLHTIANLQFSLLFADRVKQYYKIEDKVDLIPKKCSYVAFNILKKILQKNNINIPFYVLLRIKLRDLLKNIFFSFKIICYPEYLFFKMHGNYSLDKKEQYKVCGNIYEGNTFDHGVINSDFFIDNKELKQNDVIFVVDIPQDPVYLKKIKCSKYKIIDFYSDLIPSFSKKKYFLSTYKKFFWSRFSFFKLIIKYPFSASNSFSTFRSILLWNLFQKRFSIQYFFRLNIAGEISGVISQKKMGAKTIFIYPGVSDQFVKERTNLQKTECLDYTHMLFDKVVSCTLSNRWLSSLQNSCAEYINIGNLFADFIFQTRINKRNDIRHTLKLNPNTTLVTFLDTSIRRDGSGIMSIEEYKIFIKSIVDLIKLYQNYNFVLSSKHLGCSLNKIDHHEIFSLFDEISSHPRGCIASNYGISAYEVMGASDIVVAASETSVLYESISGGIKTIMYDPLNKHNHPYRVVEHWPNIVAHNFDDLKKLIEYWMQDNSQEHFTLFQETYFKKDVDQFCDGRAIERLRQILSSGQSTII